MNKLLEDYLKNNYNWDTVIIKNFNVDGSICYVEYYIHESQYDKMTTNINIWDMLLFLNNKQDGNNV